MNREEIRQRLIDMFTSAIIECENARVLQLYPYEQEKIPEIHKAGDEYIQEFIKLLKQLTD